MTAKIVAGAVVGIKGILVVVEVDVLRGLPAFDVVGLPGTAVRESRTRVKTALMNSGFEFKPRRVVVNLAPADIKKEGPAFDLPIALGILAASGHLPVREALVLGELALDGKVRPVRGVLPVVERAVACGISTVVVPAENGPEASLVEKARVLPVTTLVEAVEAYESGTSRRKVKVSPPAAACPAVDFSAIRGQTRAKRALEIAAAGRHNLLLLGPPGGGKSMLASALAGILPPLSAAERLTVTKVYSVAGLLGGQIAHQRPFRRPHHACTPAAMLGGGRWISPGELSLAHLGVLFLDELPEFRRDVLEALRQPLEEKQVVLARAGRHYVFPSAVTLVAAANLCPCGYYGDADRECRCSDGEIARYRRRLSGPLIDRFDLIVEVPRVSADELFASFQAESSAVVQKRVMRAWQFSRKRGQGVRMLANADLAAEELDKICQLKPEASSLLHQVAGSWHLSPRVCHKLLRVARTIADLRGNSSVGEKEMAEAVQLRRAEEILLSSR